MRTPLCICVAASAFIAAGAPAHAADMRGMPPPMMAAGPGWTGCYIGGHLRISGEDTKTNTFNTVTGALDRSDGYNKSNAYDGLQLGCDLAMSSRVVVGGVADVSSGEQRDEIFTDPTGTISFKTHTDIHAQGTVRGRIGYTFENVPILSSVLLYGTGGWAWMNTSFTRTQLVGITGLAVPGTAESARLTRSGPTGGVGIEWYFGKNWTWFLQYRYTDFGSATVTYPIAQRSATITTTQNALEFGLNYRF
jgi:outer membrane immunogenic protein